MAAELALVAVMFWWEMRLHMWAQLAGLFWEAVEMHTPAAALAGPSSHDGLADLSIQEPK